MNSLNTSRILKFAVSILAFLIAYFEHSLSFVLVGAYFAILGIFNFGCNGSRSCGPLGEKKIENGK